MAEKEKGYYRWRLYHDGEFWHGTLEIWPLKEPYGRSPLETGSATHLTIRFQANTLRWKDGKWMRDGYPGEEPREEQPSPITPNDYSSKDERPSQFYTAYWDNIQADRPDRVRAAGNLLGKMLRTIDKFNLGYRFQCQATLYMAALVHMGYGRVEYKDNKYRLVHGQLFY